MVMEDAIDIYALHCAKAYMYTYSLENTGQYDTRDSSSIKARHQHAPRTHWLKMNATLTIVLSVFATATAPIINESHSLSLQSLNATIPIPMGNTAVLGLKDAYPLLKRLPEYKSYTIVTADDMRLRAASELL